MSRRVPSRGSDQFNLRLPDGMRDRLKEEAETNGRSLNMEIVARLEESLSGEKKIRPDESFAFADGAILGVLQALETMSKDGLLDLTKAIALVKEGADRQLKSRDYDKSVVGDLLKSGGFLPPQ